MVIANNEHRSAFGDLFRKSGCTLDYVVDVIDGQAPLDWRNIATYLADHGNLYDAAVLCGCCADILPVVLSKQRFPGKTIMLDLGYVPSQMLDFSVDSYSVEGIARRNVDLYVKCPVLPSKFFSQVYALFDMPGSLPSASQKFLPDL